MDSGGQNSWILPGAAYYTTILRFLLAQLQQEHTLQHSWQNGRSCQVLQFMNSRLSSKSPLPITEAEMFVCEQGAGIHTPACILGNGQSHSAATHSVLMLSETCVGKHGSGPHVGYPWWLDSGTALVSGHQIVLWSMGTPMALLQGRGFSPGSITYLSGFRN